MNNWVSEFQFSLWTAGEGTVCQKSSGWQEEVLGADLELNKKGAWTIILWELIIFVGSGLNARSFWIMIAQRNLIICISFTSKRKDIHVLLLKPFADVKIISRGEHLATYASFSKKNSAHGTSFYLTFHIYTNAQYFENFYLSISDNWLSHERFLPKIPWPKTDVATFDAFARSCLNDKN